MILILHGIKWKNGVCRKSCGEHCTAINISCYDLLMVLEDAFACLFLLRHGALPTVVESASGYSVLHLLAVWDSDEAEDIAKILLEKGSDPNVVALDGR